MTTLPFELERLLAGRWPRHIAALLRWVSFLILIVAAPGLQAQEVIVNSGVPQNEISKHALRAIFGMRLREWPDGSPITVVILPPDDTRHTEFCRKVLYVLPRNLENNWNHLVFSGTGQLPVVVPSEEEMRRVVAKTPGAIGYLIQHGDLDEKLRKIGVNR